MTEAEAPEIEGDAGRRGPATARDVARAAGVSRIMVSRAFNPDASVRAEKREHILRVAGSLGYHPDMAARAMVTGRSNLVAVLVPSLSRTWESQEIDALVEALQRHGMATLVFRASLPALQDGALRVRAYKPAAVISLLDTIAPTELTAYFGRSPAIYPHYGEPLTELPPDQRIDRLHINQQAGIGNAVKLLAGSGRRRVAYVAGSDIDQVGQTQDANSDRDRYRSLRASVGEHGLDLVARLEGDFDYDTARHSVVNYLRHGGRADAFLAANDTSAFGVLDALRFDLGLSVPRDAAVIGFDNIREAGWAAYDLTTIGAPVEVRVAALMRLLRARLADPDGPPRVETVTASLVVRSTA